MCDGFQDSNPVPLAYQRYEMYSKIMNYIIFFREEGGGRKTKLFLKMQRKTLENFSRTKKRKNNFVKNVAKR